MSVSKTKALVMACAVVFFAHSASAQTPKSVDSTKPVEREDGSLDFQKLSDRNLNEFIATHTYLLNRQIMTLNNALLMSMNRTKSLAPNESMTMLSQSMEMNKVFMRSINGWFPEDPKAREAMEKMLQLSPSPNR